MTQRILRHELAITDRQWVELPANGQLLSVAASRTDPENAIDLWALDCRTGVPRQVEVFVMGTGHPLSKACEEALLLGKFLGTVVTPAGFVWHVTSGQWR